MTANYYCCLPWDIHLQCAIMDPHTHINCRTQTAIMMPSHVRGGKRKLKPLEASGGNVGQSGKRCPEQHRADVGLGGHPPLETTVAPSPDCQHLLRAVGFTGVICQSQARKYTVKKKELPGVCGNSAWEMRVVAAILFVRLLQTCFFTRICQAFPECRGVTWPPPPLLLHQVFSNVFCWLVLLNSMEVVRQHRRGVNCCSPESGVNKQAFCLQGPWLRSWLRSWGEKQAGWSHPEPCLCLGRVRGTFGEPGPPPTGDRSLTAHRKSL